MGKIYPDNLNVYPTQAKRMTDLRSTSNPLSQPSSSEEGFLSLPKGDNNCPAIKEYERYIHLFDYYEPTRQKWLRKTCKRSDCTYCINQHNPTLYRRILSFVEGDDSGIWFFITLSTTNYKDLRRSYDGLQLAWNAWRKRASKVETHPWNDIVKWISVIEVKFTRRQLYNVHRHILCATNQRFILDFRKFHEEWNRATGLQAHCNIKRLHHPLQRSVEYLSKYMAKLDTTDKGEVYLHGRRRLSSSVRPTPSQSTRKNERFGYCCMTKYQSECNHPHCTDTQEVINKRNDTD